MRSDAAGHDFTLVSGADTRYARCLEQLLLSVVRVYGSTLPRVHVWDLGLSRERARALLSRFPFVQLRTFDFSAHPPHLRMREREHNTCGWKPLVIRESARGQRGVLLWLDSATVLLRPLHDEIAFARETGLYTPFGGAASVEELTHPLTLERMQVGALARRERQRHAGTVGLNLDMTLPRGLLEAWCHAVQVPGLLCPEGSSLDNHRFDQSLWNIVLAEMTRRSSMTASASGRASIPASASGRASIPASASGRRHELQLTLDEIDVSSPDPVTSYRTRNKVPSWVPLFADPLVRGYYNVRRRVDVAVLRTKTRTRVSISV